MFVRWMGAFGKNSSLYGSLNYEMTNTTIEVACEHLAKGKSSIKHARIGIIIPKSAILKMYQGDVWSIREGDKLKRTRRGSGYSDKKYHECFSSPLGSVKGCKIIITNVCNLKKETKREAYRIASKYNMEIVLK